MPWAGCSALEAGAGFRNSDTGLLYREQRPAGSQLTLVLGSWSGGNGIKRPYSSHLERYGKQVFPVELCSWSRVYDLVPAVVSRASSGKVSSLLAHFPLFSFCPVSHQNCAVMWIACNLINVYN